MPDQCRCEHCCHREPCDPCRKPFPPHSFLLPRILASGREWLRRTPFTLRVTGLPACAEAPFTLVSVSLGSDAPRWEALPSPSPHQMCLRLCIPVCCQVRDACGSLYSGDALVETDMALRLTMPVSECWRNTMVVLPCVRLVCVPPPSDDACFEAQLELLVEVYMTRWETCMAGVPKAIGNS